MSEAMTAPGGAALPQEGLVRVGDFVGKGKALPIGRSTWWQWVSDGKAPKPLPKKSRLTFWDVRDIRQFIDDMAAKDVAA